MFIIVHTVMVLCMPIYIYIGERKNSLHFMNRNTRNNKCVLVSKVKLIDIQFENKIDRDINLQNEISNIEHVQNTKHVNEFNPLINDEVESIVKNKITMQEHKGLNTVQKENKLISKVLNIENYDKIKNEQSIVNPEIRKKQKYEETKDSQSFYDEKEIFEKDLDESEEEMHWLCFLKENKLQTFFYIVSVCGPVLLASYRFEISRFIHICCFKLCEMFRKENGLHRLRII
ncbi:hypothetical protein COBT_000274 [Conglomerata obtusa]